VAGVVVGAEAGVAVEEVAAAEEEVGASAGWFPGGESERERERGG
jgi:hypothetical protein